MKKIFAITLFFGGVTLFAQDAPFAPSANVNVQSATVSTVAATNFTIDVHANLTGVNGVCNGNSVPAVLGGYTIPINFNQAQVQFVSAAACNSPQFNAAPTATAPATANANGQVSITASQVNQAAPTGDVCVATLTFTSVNGSGATFTPQNTTVLSSAFQNCAGQGTGGPASIPYTTTPITIPPSTGIPTLSQLALAALAIALAGGALFTRSLR